MKNVISISIVFVALFCSVISARADVLTNIGRSAGMDPVNMSKQVTMGTMNVTKQVTMGTMNMTQQVTMATLDMTKQVNMATLNMTKQVNMGSLIMTKSIFQNPSKAVSNFKAYSLECKNQISQEKEKFKATNSKYVDQQKENKMQADGYAEQDKSDLTKEINAE